MDKHRHSDIEVKSGTKGVVKVPRFLGTCGYCSVMKGP